MSAVDTERLIEDARVRFGRGTPGYRSAVQTIYAQPERRAPTTAEEQAMQLVEAMRAFQLAYLRAGRQRAYRLYDDAELVLLEAEAAETRVRLHTMLRGAGLNPAVIGEGL